MLEHRRSNAQRRPACRSLLPFAAAASALVLVAVVPAQANRTGPPEEVASGCGNPRDAAAGPYDYRTVDPWIRRDVEVNHFTAQVQMLERGQSTRVPGGVGRDINYTLMLMPNHPQALLAMMRYSQKLNQPTPRGARYPVACYFERAIAFVPDDYAVRVLYGIYLARSGQPQQARQHLEAATQNAPDDPNVQYNAGLAYFELKDFDKARESAQRAYALGFQLPGLRRKLEAEGKWSN
jgi:hypothetical protein